MAAQANRNSETRCFNREAKQLKPMFYSDIADTSVHFQFRLFRVENSFEGHPSPGSLVIQEFPESYQIIKQFIFLITSLRKSTS